jgi:rare lipoprotein A
MTRVALAFMLLVVGPLEVTIAQSVLPDGAPVSHKKWIWQDAVPQTEPAPTRGNRSLYSVKGQTYTVLPTADDYVEEGIASWYGTKFHGRQTANGDIYDLFAATAAHRSLPIPSYVRVTNLRNRRAVVLRVNDRGPFHDSRLIDLSYGAALALGFAESGTAPVRVEAVTPPGNESQQKSTAERSRYLQLGAFKSLQTAERVSKEAADRQGWEYPMAITAVDVRGQRLHRVRVGPFDNPSALQHAQDILEAGGYSALIRLP